MNHEQMERFLCEYDEYTRSHPLTEEERDLLRKWVADGNSPYTNPDFLVKEDNQPFSYVESLRFWDDMENVPFTETAKNGWNQIAKLKRQLFYLWLYLAQNDDPDEAYAYVTEHMETPSPLDLCDP